MFCGNCGEQIPDESTFCPYCGRQTDEWFEDEEKAGGGRGRRASGGAAGGAAGGGRRTSGRTSGRAAAGGFAGGAAGGFSGGGRKASSGGSTGRSQGGKKNNSENRKDKIIIGVCVAVLAVLLLAMGAMKFWGGKGDKQAAATESHVSNAEEAGSNDNDIVEAEAISKAEGESGETEEAEKEEAEASEDSEEGSKADSKEESKAESEASEESGEKTDSAKSAAKESVDGIVYYADVYEALTLRKAADTKAEAITRLKPFTEMYIIDYAEDPMVKVRTIDDDLVGYVNGKYLTESGVSAARAGRTKPTATPTPTPTPTPTEAPAAENLPVYYADVYEYLTLRNAPSTSAAAIALLDPFTEMYILEYAADPMVRVRTVGSSLEGYVNKKYIKPIGTESSRAGRTKPASTDTPQYASETVYYADVYEYLTLRNAPSTSAAAIALLDPFTEMYILEYAADPMVKVRTVGSSLEGYVNRKYITPSGTASSRAGRTKPASTDTPQYASETVYYADVYEYLTLRSAASTSASELARLAPFTAMKKLSQSGKMYYVYVLDTGQTGWVNSDYLSTNPNYMQRAGKQ